MSKRNEFLNLDSNAKEFPILKLPFDYKRTLSSKCVDTNFNFIINEKLSAEVQYFSKKQNTSSFNLLLKIFKIIIACYDEPNKISHEIIVGTKDKLTDTNIKLLQTEIDFNKTFRENLACNSNTVYEVETSFCQVFISNENPNNFKSNLESEVSLWINTENKEIKGTIQYRSDLFNPLTIERLIDYFIHNITSIISNVDKPLKDNLSLPASQKNQILEIWNNTTTDITNYKCIHNIFSEHAKNNPAKIAIENSKAKLTYGELETLSNRCANNLIEMGVKEGDLVGVLLTRDLHLPIALLGILKSGAGYVPLDPDYPKDRLEFMMENASPHVVITEPLLKNKLLADRFLLTSDFINNSDYDFPLKEIHENLDNRAYVIYTSGSTGKPKGVEIKHLGMINFLTGLQKTFSVTDQEKLLATATSNFDMSVTDFFLPLLAGGTIFLANNHEMLDGLAIKNILDTKNITLMQATPSMWRLLLASGWKGNKNLKIQGGGEAFPIDLVQTLVSICKRVWNGYGPTEISVQATAKELTANDEIITIGKPLDNTKLYILDNNLKQSPIGGIGQLYISGIGVSKGYLKREDLTLEKFMLDPFNSGMRMYASGDLVRYRFDGELEYWGRIDNQVKVRGFRIEIDEIEQALIKQNNVENAVAKVFGDQDTSFICAYIVGDVDTAKLRDGLRDVLPDYMIPSYFIKLETIPLSPAGKIDYINLPKPGNKRPDLSTEYAEAKTKIEIDILKCWEKFLKIENIGIDDSFFDVGGNSLMAIKILIEINQITEKNLSVINFFEHPTIRKLASFLENNEDELDVFIKRQNIKNENKNDDIAIISMTGRFPGAKNVEEFWENLVNNKNTIECFNPEMVNTMIDEETRSDSNYVFVHGACPGQKNFDNLLFGMTPVESEIVDPQQRKFLELAYEALELAGYTSDKYNGHIGIFAGVGSSKYYKLVEQYPEKMKIIGDINVLVALEKDYVATRTAFKLNCKGPAISVHTACSTSLVAVIEAVNSLRLNNCDMALAGGIAISGTPNAGHLFVEGGIFSHNNECRSFDSEATGTVFTDGGGVVVLKRLLDAEKDGDTILAVIKGVGINNDGANKMSFTAPSIAGQAEVILRAQQDARITADSIGFIEAHGTATPVGDPIEVEALTKVFKKSTQNKNFCYLGSVKSNVGHLTAGAGVASLIKTVKALSTGRIPGTVHYQKPNKHLVLGETPFIISNQTVEFPNVCNLRRAGVSSFGVGGTNAHIILEEYKETAKDKKQIDDSAALFKLSARTEKQLNIMFNNLVLLLQKTEEKDWKKIAYTLEVGRKEYKFRKFLVAKGLADIEKISMTNSGTGEFVKKPNLYFMFPGQGSHYKEMGKVLYQTNLIFKDALDNCCALIKDYISYDIKTIIFGENSEADLSNTYYSQPAIFIIEYSLATTLKTLGFKPVSYIGHSIGEFVAATLNGVFSLRDGLKIIAKRAELMQKLPFGKMLSVGLPQEKVKDLILETNLDIAAVNGTNACVVAGDFNSIDNFKKKLEAQNIASIEIKTSHAFHSRMMEPAVLEFKNFLDAIAKIAPEKPMYSTVTTELESEIFSTSEYWANHIVKTVLFSPTIKKVLSQKDILLVEVGTRNILTNITKKEQAILSNFSTKVVTLLSNSIQLESLSFNKALGDLWISGVKVNDPNILFFEFDRKRVIAPTYAFEENKFWLENKNIKISNKFATEAVVSKEIVMNEENSLIKKALVDLFEKTSGIDVESVDQDTTFLEMGMDSLLLTQVALMIKKELNVPITFRQLMENYNSINSLTSHLIGKTNLKKEVIKHQVDLPKTEIKVDIPALSSMASPNTTPLVSKQVVPTVESRPFVQPMIQNMNIQRSTNLNGLEEIVNRQIELMSQQLMILSGNQVVSQVSSETIIEKIPEIKKEIEIEIKKELSEQVVPTATKASVSNVKVAFGAQARITTEKNLKLTEEQTKKIKNFVDKYVNKTKASKKFTQDNRKNHSDPRVVTGFKPESKEIVYPVVIKRSHLQNLWDLDDNKYIDMTCGFGSNFFGNQNEKIKKYLLKQIEDGIEIGPQHPLVSEVSKLVNELTGNERTAFCNTGSEAVLGAMRAARTITGRDKIVIFSGAYHGIHDEVIVRAGKNGKAYPASPGITAEAVSNMIVLEYGTPESLKVIREMASELAAVLIEPVQSRRCDFVPVEFLKEVRAITEKSDTCLIFDEVITGFRIHPAGMQGYLGIRADLCTYGKIVGGGMPIGVVSGKTKYMDALDGGYWEFGDDSTPTVGVTYFAGTFVRHPLALAAAKGALEIIKEGGVELLNKLTQRADKFSLELNNYLKEQNVPIKIDNFGSLVKPKWTSEVANGDLFFAILRYKGVHVYDGFPWFINLAHTEEQLQEVMIAFKASVVEMQEMELFPKNESKAIPEEYFLDPKIFDQKGAPMVGAKLGRDEQGNPAWFVEDKDHAGQYFILKKG